MDVAKEYLPKKIYQDIKDYIYYLIIKINILIFKLKSIK